MRIRYYVVSAAEHNKSITEEEALAGYSAQIAMLDAADPQLDDGVLITVIPGVGSRCAYVNGIIIYYLAFKK